MSRRCHERCRRRVERREWWWQWYGKENFVCELKGVIIEEILNEMIGNGRQFVELNDEDDHQTNSLRSPVQIAKFYFNKIRRQRPVFLAMLEALFPKLFYGWVVVFACGIGWWCVAPAATFGVGVYVDYWLTDPGAARVPVFM